MSQESPKKEETPADKKPVGFVDKVTEWTEKPTTWGFALVTTVKGAIAVLTVVTMIMSFADLHTNYKLSPPADRCVPFFNTVTDASSSREQDMVAYNYDQGMASIRVCTSDSAYWTSKLGSYQYDPFCYGIQQNCNGTACSSTSIDCTTANSSTDNSATEACSDLNTTQNNWIYGISVNQGVSNCDVEFVRINPPLPPCLPTTNEVLSFQKTNTDVQTVLQLLLIVPLFAALVQLVITINYTLYLSKPLEEGAKKDAARASRSKAWLMRWKVHQERFCNFTTWSSANVEKGSATFQTFG